MKVATGADHCIGLVSGNQVKSFSITSLSKTLKIAQINSETMITFVMNSMFFKKRQIVIIMLELQDVLGEL